MRPARGAQAKGLDVPLLDWGGTTWYTMFIKMLNISCVSNLKAFQSFNKRRV